MSTTGYAYAHVRILFPRAIAFTIFLIAIYLASTFIFKDLLSLQIQ
ncbi:hypothetical protein [Nostoc sp.]